MTCPSSRQPLLLAAALLAVAAVALSTPARAAERLTTVFEEREDGAVRPASGAELAVIDALTSAGMLLVDDVQARRVRSLTDAGTLLGGQVSPVLTPDDADLILAAVCTLTPVRGALIADRAFRYNAHVEARLIAVGSAQVLGAFSVDAKGALGFDPESARADAAHKVGSELAAMVLKKKATVALLQRIRLEVRGVPDVTAGERVAAAVRALPEVAAAEVESTRREAMVFTLDGAGRSAREIALALDAARGLGVVVFGHSEHTIVADYSVEAATTLDLVVTPLAMRGGRRADAWQGAAFAEILGTALANRPILHFPRGRLAVALTSDKPRRWRAELEAMSVEPARALVLVGTVSPTRDGVHVTARVVAAATGDAVLTAQRTCPAVNPEGCVAELGEGLTRDLLPALERRRDLLPAAQPRRASRPTPAASPKPLAIGAVAVTGVFPARDNSRTPVGTVTVSNAGSVPLSDLVVTAALGGFAPPVDVPVGALAAGETRAVPVTLVLDRAALAAHDTAATAVLDLTFRYVAAGFEVVQRRGTAVVVHGRNAIDWEQPESVAGFVTPTADVIQRVARRIARTQPGVGGGPLARAVTLFVGLGAFGARYQADPASPFGGASLDYVQFPGQTLERQSGDCDDLAVLFAAVAEAVDLATLLVVTPDHVFVATWTGVPEHNRAALAVDDEARLVVHDGMLWLPLETTLMGHGGSVEAAWKAAGDQLVRWAGDPAAVHVIDLRAAWTRFPPSGLAGASVGVPEVDDAQVSALVAAAIRASDADRAEALERALSRLDAAIAARPEDGRLVLEKGYVLALNGRREDAAAVFGALPRKDDLRAAAATDEGNLALAAGDLKAARAAYARALAITPDDPRIHVDAALAAHLAGDAAAFDDHVIACLRAGGDALIERLSRAGVGVGTRGAAAGDLLVGLQAALARAAAKAGRPLAANKVAARASDASGTGPSVQLAEQLHWIW